MLLSVLVATVVAQASSVSAAPDGPARNYGNLRIGAATSSKRPEICLELTPIERLGIEACGTGSGFLHRDPEPEIAHFRGKFQLTSFKTDIGWIQPRLGFGFAEMQIGEDGPGFHFGGVGPLGTETAGPELGLSIRALWPVWSGFELIGELGVNAAWFPNAPKLNRPQSPFQPSANFTLGVGF